MADATTFYREFIATARETVNLMNKLQTTSDRMETDSTLAQAAADAATASGRPDLTAEDFDAAKEAIIQILFVWNSGTPAQKAAFYELL